jgi:hypothetical protein
MITIDDIERERPTVGRGASANHRAERETFEHERCDVSCKDTVAVYL